MKLLWHHLIKKLQFVGCCSKILWVHTDARLDIPNLHNYFNLHVCPSLRPVPSVPSVPSHLRVSLRLEFQRPSQTAAERGEAELRILDFKTTWSEFQKPIQTAAKRGEAELRIFDFKTTL